MTLSWTRTAPTGLSEDKGQFKLDLLNVTSDALDTTWTTGDYTAIMALVVTFKNSMLPLMSDNQAWSEARFYRMAFNPIADITRPFAESGPPQQVTAMTSTGTAGSGLPFQVAPTITFRTAWPGHWGRAYNPTPGIAHIDGTARLTSTYRSSMRTAWATLLSGLHDAGFYPVVPVGQLNKQPFHALLSPTVLAVDDIPDIQRRRRPKQVFARTIS